MAKDLANAERSSESTQHEDTPPSTTNRPAPVLRYWHTTATETQSALQNKSDPNTSSPIDVSVFQRPISSNAITTIELFKEEPPQVVELESSDEDEVVEVALPPKPTITIESSDEETISVIPIEASTPQTKQPSLQLDSKKKKKQKNKRRAESASPVPSVVSSISDDFIRGDCVTFNISRRPLVEHFDLNLHGSDLLDQHSNNSLSQKTKKKKAKNKNKDKSSSETCTAPTPTKAPTPPPTEAALEQIFTTPQSKGKRKSNKNYAVSKLSIPDPDIYETDSNQSAAVESVPETARGEGNNSKDSDRTEAVKTPVQAITELEITQPTAVTTEPEIIDLASQEVVICKDPVPIEDNLIMGNVTGLESSQSTPNFSDKRASLGKRPHSSMKGSPNRSFTSQRSTRSREEQGIFESNNGSKENVREHMERYYNDSWGGENFDHVEIQKTMSRDKSLWAIDPRDKMSTSSQKKRCHYCNHIGHGYDRCRLKPRICHMCGVEGHYEPRCPNRMCLRCGAPNSIFSIHCRSCMHWNRTYCDVCQVMGHPIENCPDLWRRYHSTVNNDGFLVKQTEFKRKDQIFCSGCARRGHLAHNCHQLPFSNLPIYTPIVFQYRPVYPPEYPTVSPAGRYFTMPDQDGDHFRSQQRPQKYQTDSYDNNKGNYNQPAPLIQNIANPTEIQPQRDSPKRPLTLSNNQEFNKKRSLSNTEVLDQGAVQVDKNKQNPISFATEKYEGVLQDNEVSNTSEVVTTANIYIEKNVMEGLKKQEGCEWLSATSVQHRVQATLEERPTTFVRISGLPADQEAFQNELKQWVRKFVMKDFSTEESPSNNEIVRMNQDDFCKDIPQNKFKLLRMLNRALAFLQSDLGDPNAIYKELLYLRNRHKKLTKTKTVSPKKLNNNRNKINEILKNLNMILVGQAGLADGSRHVRELYSLQDILMKLKKHELPYELRNKVGEHYHFIFNSMARDDYVDLMNIFYNKAIVKRTNVKRNNQPKALVKVGKKETKSLKQFRGIKIQAQGSSVLQVNSENKAAPNQPQAGSKEYVIDQIQTFQKKLRKQTTGDEQRQQGKQVLLNRLRKFQVQAKRRGLFQKQCIQLDKLLAETKKFCGES